MPPERGGALVPARARPQTEAPAVCVLNRAASELSGGVSDRTIGTGEALEAEGTSARRPFPAPRFNRKFWSAGDYDPGVGSSGPHPSTAQC